MWLCLKQTFRPGPAPKGRSGLRIGWLYDRSTDDEIDAGENKHG
jgi:hypothetical protein